jgi:hypothetical protein
MLIEPGEAGEWMGTNRPCAPQGWTLQRDDAEFTQSPYELCVCSSVMDATCWEGVLQV